MLLPVIVRAAEQGRREPPSHARWHAAVHELREAMEQEPELAPEHLPEFLVGIDPEEADEALSDLVAEHMRHAWRAGRPTFLEDYVAALGSRCSILAEPGALPADLVEDEFLARHSLPGGDAPHLAEYARRFARRPDVLALLARRILGDGRYVKLRELGRGATGVVHEACDRKLVRTVAIKEPYPEHLTAEAVARFVTEAQTAARLDHPGIVRVHEVARGVDAPWFVMELVRGASLAERIRELHHPGTARTRRESRRLRRSLLRTVVVLADAMAHAHARGVQHRDLKPGNIVIGNAGEAVLLDWGAATTARAAAAELVVGTPESMAPEQARGLADERSDVFGLGSILHEVLTGCSVRAWPNGERPADWQRIVAGSRVVAPRRRMRGIPRALDRIRRKALAHDPDDRYQSADALADALRAHLDDRRQRPSLLGAVLRQVFPRMEARSSAS